MRCTSAKFALFLDTVPDVLLVMERVGRLGEVEEGEGSGSWRAKSYVVPSMPSCATVKTQIQPIRFHAPRYPTG